MDSEKSAGRKSSIYPKCLRIFFFKPRREAQEPRQFGKGIQRVNKQKDAHPTAITEMQSQSLGRAIFLPLDCRHRGWIGWEEMWLAGRQINISNVPC